MIINVIGGAMTNQEKLDRCQMSYDNMQDPRYEEVEVEEASAVEPDYELMEEKY
jgi:hypothetical protein